MADFTPINYSVDVQTPFQAALQGYQAGAAIRQDQFQQQQQQAALAQQQQQQQVIRQLMANPSPTASDYSNATLLVPGLKDQFKQAWDMRSTEQQQNDSQHIGQVYAALQSNQPAVASKLLRDRAAAAKNSGDAKTAQDAETMAGVIDANPKFAQSLVGMKLSAIPGGDKIITNSIALNKAPAELRTAEANADTAETNALYAGPKAQQELQTGVWNNANTKSQIEERAARLGLDRDKLTTETQTKLTELSQKFGQLPDDARKIVNDSALTAVSSGQQVQQYQDLAGQIDALGGSWGAGSGAKEWLKRATGSEDTISSLKREYTRMASQGVIKLLPPGPASDKDIENAKAGIPDANASPQVMASYLRGMAKLSAYDAVLNNVKAEWAGSVQHLGKTPKDIEVDSVKVPAGTTFTDFARKYLASKAKAMDDSARTAGRSYMRFAQPAAAPAVPPNAGIIPGTD